MQLDEWQVQDFHNHWGDSYVLVGDKVGYVTGSDRNKKICTVQVQNHEGMWLYEAATYPMTAIEPWRPKAAFYNAQTVPEYGSHKMLCLLRRFPRQAVKRGIDNRNTVISDIHVNGQQSTIKYNHNYSLSRFLVSSFAAPSYEIQDVRSLVSSIIDPVSDFSGVALSPKIAICRGDNNVPYVLCETCVVGYVDKTGVIKVFAGASCFKKMLEKQAIFPVEVL